MLLYLDAGLWSASACILIKVLSSTKGALVRRKCDDTDGEGRCKYAAGIRFEICTVVPKESHYRYTTTTVTI
jgi:hypothetical protein